MKQQRQKLIPISLLIFTVVMGIVVDGALGQSGSPGAECGKLGPDLSTREIDSGASHCYLLDLEKDNFVRVRVEQRGVDLNLTLADSRGKIVSQIDSPNGYYGQEILNAIVPSTDVYRLEIKTDDSKPKGKYTILREVLRPATENDRKLIAGIATFLQAQKAESPQIALELYREALTAFRAAQDKFQEGMALTYMGAILLNAGRFDEALAHFEPAVAIFTTDYVYERADALQGVAKSNLRLSQLAKALESFQEALSLFQSIQYLQAEAQTLSNIGLVYLESARKQQALKNFERALEIAKINGFIEDEAAYYNNIGRAYDDLGNLPKAGENFALALKRTNNNQERGYVLLSLGKTSFDSGDPRQALAEFEEARKLFIKAADRFGETAVINALGRAHSQLDNKDQAKEMYYLALRQYRQFGHMRGEAITFGNLMAVWQSLGNRRLAIFFGKQSINAHQKVRASARQINDESQRTFTANVADTYRMLAALLLEEERIDEAQEVLGLLKQEEFSRFTRSSSSSSPVLQIGFFGQEVTASREYDELHDRFSRFNRQALTLRRESAALARSGQTVSAEKESELRKLQSDLTEIDSRFVELLKSFAGRFTAQAATKSDAPVLLARSWQKRLSDLEPGTVLLSTLLIKDRYYAILTTSDSQTVHSVKVDRPLLEEKITRYRRNLEDPQTLSDYLGLSQQLYQELIRPVADDLERLSAKTLLLSLDGELRYVPFATLHDGKRFLVEKYATNVVALAQPPIRGKKGPETWRALGAGVSNDPSDPLPRVPAELNFVVRNEVVRGDRKGSFPGKRLLDKDFSTANLVAELAKRPDLVHIASHFSLSSGDESSYLLLGNGERLNLSALRDEKDTRFDMSSVELLTLSACETGSKETNDANGVEIENLSVIVQKRGAKAVIATLWLVSDDSAPEFMREFYRRYKTARGTLSKAQALRAAQAAMLKNSKYSHPAHWGAFIGMGDL
ncbi:MAG: CHAT domain-containing protein [Chloracidobacterium sp.]|nr:CHAT domain-containing protein [Chloracidobacterium sp.]